MSNPIGVGPKKGMVKEVAMREITTRGRTKAFKVITAILVVAAIAGPVIAALWPDGSDDLREIVVGVTQDDPEFQRQVDLFAEGSLDVSYELINADAVDDALSNGDIDVAVEPGPTMAWDKAVDYEIAGVLYAVFQGNGALEKGRAAGLTDAEIANLVTPVPVEERFADETDSGDDLATGVAFLGLMAAFILPQAYGQLTMLSVIEEKSTRVIEVLLSHIRPRTLLTGKILGLGALAIAQLLVIVLGLLGALLLTDSIDIPSSVWRFVPILLVSLLGGLAVYNTVFALLGSLISRQEDAAQVMLPVFIPLMAGYIAGQTAVFGDADTLVMRILTFFPMTAPMMLPVRVAKDAIAPWEIAVSLGLLVLAVWLLIRIAGRVYEFTLLHTGSRVGWGKLLKLSRGAILD